MKEPENPADGLRFVAQGREPEWELTELGKRTLSWIRQGCDYEDAARLAKDEAA